MINTHNLFQQAKRYQQFFQGTLDLLDTDYFRCIKDEEFPKYCLRKLKEAAIHDEEFLRLYEDTYKNNKGITMFSLIKICNTWTDIVDDLLKEAKKHLEKINQV